MSMESLKKDSVLNLSYKIYLVQKQHYTLLIFSSKYINYL